MQRKNNKDYLEKLINHTMRHGKKIAAIGLLAKSVSVFVQKLARQGIISDSVSLRRVSTRPRLSSTLFNHSTHRWRCDKIDKNQQFPFAFDQLKPVDTDNSHPITIPRPVPTLFFSITAATIPFLEKTEDTIGKATDRTIGKANDWLLNSTQKPVEIGTSKKVTPKNEKMSVRKKKARVSRGAVEKFVKDAISHIKPSLETRKKKIAGITRHIPSLVHPSRGEGLAIRWLIAAAKEKQRRGGRGFAQCLSNELLDAYLKKGEPKQKRDSLHKLAENNRSYIRFRWW
jgi:small subunit ribosomal protein S7